MVRSFRPRRLILAVSAAAMVTASLAAVPVLAQADPSGSPEPVPSAQPLSSPGAPSPEAASPQASVIPVDGPWPSVELAAVEAIAAATGGFVAVGSDGGFPPTAAAWTSNDGREWESASVAPLEPDTVMTAVAASETGVVALGTETSEGSGGPDRVAAWHSSDGRAWERATIQRPARNGLGVGIRDVAAGPAGYLALATFFGQDAGPFRLYASADGTAWAPAELPGPKSVIWSALVGIPDGYLLIGSTPQGRASVWRSSEGQGWERIADAPRLVGAAASDDGIVVGMNERRIWTTEDLVAWQRVWQSEDPEAAPEKDTLLWAEWDGTRFAVSGIDFEGCPENVDECARGFLLLSSDGTSWSESDGPDGVSGPDAGTAIADIASDGTSTIVLGVTGPGRSYIWQPGEAALEAS